MPTPEDPYRERPDSLPSTRTPLVDRLLAWFEVHHAKVAKRVVGYGLVIFLLFAPVAFACFATVVGIVTAFIAATCYVISEDDAENDAYSKAKWLLVGLCSLAVAVLSASALYAFVPDFEWVTEDECECSETCAHERLPAEEAKP